MVFTSDEIEYLTSNTLGRLATVSTDGQPDVVPVAVEFDGASFWVGGPSLVTRTRKFRNVADGNSKVSLVVDDLLSMDPFIARGVRIYGRAEQPFERGSGGTRRLHAHQPTRLVELEPCRGTRWRHLVRHPASRTQRHGSMTVPSAPGEGPR
jgi:pyridoxamine 5'-phosphate oxidase family protein